MSRSLEFVVPGQPRGKGRPRFARVGKGVRAYSTDNDVAHESSVAYLARQAGQMLDGAVAIHIKAHYRIPKSFSRKKREQAIDGALRPTTKPDLDNVVKAILDGLNHVAYADDAQVVEVQAQKQYGTDPHVEVCVQELT